MRFNLAVGDKLVLMSNGIAEATDADGQLFGFERVLELVRSANSVADVVAEAQRFGQEERQLIVGLIYSFSESEASTLAAWGSMECRKEAE
jgi:serine phosphatase RsbU (regulator of sigma subunit)